MSEPPPRRAIEALASIGIEIRALYIQRMAPEMILEFEQAVGDARAPGAGSVGEDEVALHRPHHDDGVYHPPSPFHFIETQIQRSVAFVHVEQQIAVGVELCIALLAVS